MTAVDIHILQTVPPSNVNRDDTGSPKTAVFGGQVRARVSSQAWKRATRQAFAGRVDQSDLGVRTKRVVELVAAEISRRDPELKDGALVLAEKTLDAAGIKVAPPKVKKGEAPAPAESGYLLFLSRHQVGKLAELAIDSAGGVIDKKAAKAAADSSSSIDIALFGRMVADSPDMNTDAAAQVAHALSVHAVETEFDYFTAVDDSRAAAEEAGAGMIGTVEFNSSTMYRYATVNVEGLQVNLGDATATVRAVQEFVRAFVTSMPTGKQNTFANRTLPDAVVVQVRDSQPINLVGAFESAIVAPLGRTRVDIAAERLTQRAIDVNTAYGTAPVASWVVLVGAETQALGQLGTVGSFETLLTGLGETVGSRLGVG